ncbi:ABC transporter permease [Oleiagrimonas sp. MCCC 1A03011]|uniref:ABC transporter permease n=1 Tax=Oleiagrimonas sp. MCCC 1A03011 TaxID=1926883 RepID=UPI000DC230C3|nr:ABC transporter permease [Oleiagrimonas sp. MCCC 1A03011]RAP59566.1 hypothetical protein BTJ49_02640 [Oleiagrimonas sp. MCCC 1A03011]
MSIVFNEILRSWRASLRRPRFLLLATAVLALGIGSSTAVFALIRGTLMQPLPYPQAQRLAAVGMILDNGMASTSPQMYQHLQGMQGVASMGIGTSLAPSNVFVEGHPVQVPTMLADRHLLPTLGVTPFLGRTFTADEDRPHGAPAVMLSYTFWQRYYGADRGVIGQQLSIEGAPHTVIGVLPKGFDLFGKTSLVLPTAFSTNSRDNGTNFLTVVRLKPGSSLASVSAQVEARVRPLYEQSDMSAQARAWYSRRQFRAISLHDNQHAGQRGVLLLFMASALLVLLIALVNLGNLMLLRALARGHDGAVRRALGASAWRQALPALADAVLVGLLASLLGVLMADFGLRLLRHVVSTDVVDLSAAVLDTGTLTLAFLAGVAAALIAAGLGVWRSGRLGDVDRLREGGRNGIGRGDQRLGRLLVVTQVTLATVLLVAAGVFLHTLYDAARTQLGFSDRGILTFELAPVKATYPDAQSVQHLSQQVLDRLRMQPGVRAAVVTTNLPVGQQFNIGTVHRPGGERFGSTQFRAISPGFFATFDIAVRKGRAFNAQDIRGGEPVAIINRVLADREYGGKALGKLIDMDVDKGVVEARIVGVVDSTSQYGPLGSQPPILYVPLAQAPDALINAFRYFEPMRFALRVQGEPMHDRDMVRRVVASVAPTQPIAHLRTLRSIVDAQTADVRMNLLLIGVFAVLALALASAGLYAVMAVSVAAREQEIGVRMALGARPSTLLAWVLRGGLLQVGAGLLLGFAVTLGVARPLRSVMLELLGRSGVLDPAAMIVVAVLLVLASLAACLIPALRAARTPPMHALRGE